VIFEKRKSGLLLWLFFEKTNHPLIVTIWKKFPFLTLIIGSKDKKPGSIYEQADKDWVMIFTEEELSDYIHGYYVENCVRASEQDILRVLKCAFEQFPTAENNKAWLDYSTWIYARRKGRVYAVSKDRD
jgi:hypothetical protein